MAKPSRPIPNASFSQSTSSTRAIRLKQIGRLSGKFPRKLVDRFEAPPDDEYYLSLHRTLGKFHELAMTFTMIAGLLNILVILDAVEGPAYGYGDGSDAEQKAAASSSAEKTVKAVPPAQPPPAPPPIAAPKV